MTDIRSWNAPDTVLFNQQPFLGAMHTSDLYFLFDGKICLVKQNGLTYPI